MTTKPNLSRRTILLGALAAALPNIALSGTNKIELLSGNGTIRELKNGRFEIVNNSEHSIAIVGKNAFLVSPGTELNFEIEDGPNGLLLRAMQLLSGAVHSAFNPKQLEMRELLVESVVIGIRGTAHYLEIEKDLERVYSCCCYGNIYVRSNVSGKSYTQKTSYHEARVITSKGEIETAPYSVPLNHYDNTLVKLEGLVGRQPKWALPNGKLNFISPFNI